MSNPTTTAPTQMTKGTKAMHPTMGLVRVVAITEHEDGYTVARVVDARMVSNRGGIWCKVADLSA